jgi:AcrR family transcriptional regulator
MGNHMFTMTQHRVPHDPDKSTRQRLLEAGLKLFAERGFRRTTVGDIETLAGLSPRSGALYKHFANKQEVLAAAVERHLLEVETIRNVLDLMPLGDLRAELTLLARWILADLDRNRELFLVFEKEGDDLAELRDRYYQEVGEFGYRVGAEFLRRALHPDGTDVDPEVLATITMNALVNQRRCEWTFERKPLGLDDARLVEGVVDIVMRFAGDDPIAPANTSGP